MSVILEAKGIYKIFGYDENKVEAIKGINLQIEQGTFVAIVGRSGSGKSTLLHILGGLCKPNKGEILLEGQSLYTMNDDKLTTFSMLSNGIYFSILEGSLPMVKCVNRENCPPNSFRLGNQDSIEKLWNT